MKNSEETLKEILEHFSLTSHPEGGSYLESYRSSVIVDDRNLSTAIFFLLKRDEFSSFHRIKSDEMWHFYLGDPLEIIEIFPNGNLVTTILGSNLQEHKLQYVVSAGNWFGSRPLKNSHFSFVGCTVAPGFDFRDFELAEREKLTQEFPQHRHVIEALIKFRYV